LADDNEEDFVPDDAATPHPGEGKLVNQSIEDELKDSYLTYAMSVIVSRALPDVRDGLKPSQRRILVAMSDLGLTPGAGTSKCAGIVGETMKTYHPHGDMAIYPTLVRMGQDWNTRYVLISKQGNFGSIAGLPPAAMRYTEARMSQFAALMLDDIKLDTVDYAPTYDEKKTEPTVLPSKFPNLLVNGSQGIAVGMATSVPPHNLGEVCDALVRVIDEPGVSIDELLEIIPGPDFPTGGIICGRTGIRRGYHTGRGIITLRARATIEEHGKRQRIVINEVPYQQNREALIKRIADLVNEDRIKGISAMRDESDLKEPVRVVIEIKRDADAEIVLNQLYEFSPLQDSFSIIFLALVDGKPRTLTIKEMLEEFIRHRVTVIRRRTQYLLARARQRKHTVEGLLLAYANIDEVIRTIRTSKTQAEAKTRLMAIECPASIMQRALGDGWSNFILERGDRSHYSLTAVQSEAILRMTLGQLVNLEEEKLGNEYRELLTEINEYLRILSDEKNILTIIRDDLTEIKRKFADKRRTEISGDEIGSIDMEDLITEENMVVTISTQGYIKRTPASTYKAQRRGGKGLTGAKTDDEDPIEHLFAASTHDYLLFFTNHGKVYWQKVYDLPQLARDSRGRAIVNLLNLAEGEKVASCIAIRDFSTPDHYLVMATRRGLVKKTPLTEYGRPKKTGIIAISLREDDELVTVSVVRKGDEILCSSAKGQACRFRQSTVRSSGRNAQGVRGIKLRTGDELVGMVVPDPDATLLTVCEKGYGKRTAFGPNLPPVPEDESDDDSAAADVPEVEEPEGEEGDSSSSRYPTKGRGGLGVRDIKTTARNGLVVAICAVRDTDEVLMMTARGKLQRVKVSDISVIGRNTQGVRIMNVEDDDKLAAVVRVPPEEAGDETVEPPAAT
jgi:DNA gyrase subunit A